jgi:hypothetical protein
MKSEEVGEIPEDDEEMRELGSPWINSSGDRSPIRSDVQDRFESFEKSPFQDANPLKRLRLTNAVNCLELSQLTDLDL